MTVAACCDADKFAFQLFQMGNPPPDGGKLFDGDPVGILARAIGMFAQLQEFANCRHRQPEVPGMLDEAEPVEVGLTIPSLVALTAHGGGKQAFLFIIPDRRDLDAGLPGHIADRKIHDHPLKL